MRRVAAASLVGLTLLATPLAGQSLFSGAGLGLPTDAVDARARALGNVGIGLWGTGILPSDPAAAAPLAVPTATFTAQPSWVDFGRDDTGEQASFRATRFPLVGIAYPAWGLGNVTFTFGSFLDQRYEATRTGTVELLGGPVAIDDAFTSEGGVSEIRLGLSRMVGQAVAVGFSVGRYNGTSTRRLVRALEGVVAEGNVLDFEAGGRWAYSASSFTGGAAVSIGDVARLAGSFTVSSELQAEASDDTQGADRAFSVPFQLRLGGTGLLAPGLAVTASWASADWSAAAADLSSGTAQATSSFGIGVELSRARLFGRNAPLRFGYRRTDLPFSLRGGSPTETVWSGGLGLGLSESAAVTLAAVDLAIERGERLEGGISESFWRAAVSLRVAGF